MLSQFCRKMQMFYRVQESRVCFLWQPRWIITRMYSIHFLAYFCPGVQPTMSHMLILAEADLGERDTEIAPLPPMFHISTSFASFLYLPSFPISSPKSYPLLLILPGESHPRYVCVYERVWRLGGGVWACVCDVCTYGAMISEAASYHVN